MKTTCVIVPWPQGLHLRPAARLARMAQGFSSNIHLQFDSMVADARSALSLLLLSASPGTTLNLSVVGEDEHEAMAALEHFFSGPETEEPEEQPGKTA